MTLIKNQDFKFYIQIPNFISDDKCDELIKDISESEVMLKGGVRVDDEQNLGVNEKFRKTSEWYLCEQPLTNQRPDKPNKDWKSLQEKIFSMAKLVNMKSFKFDIQECDDELKLIKYENTNFYTWHTDMNSGNSSLRKLTAIVQLTDPSEYEGGELQFALQDHDMNWYEVPKEKGSITFFPTFLSHRVKPVISGTRYVLQEFFIGNHFK